MLGQFNLQKFVSSITQNGLKQSSDSSWVKTLARQLCNKSLYALNLCSEVLVTPDDTVLLSIEGYGDKRAARKKAVLHHKASHCDSMSIAHLVSADETFQLICLISWLILFKFLFSDYNY